MIKEVEISAPIEKFLEDSGFRVRSEVKNCDITAIKDDKLIVVECKCSVNLKLIYQCVERQEFCDNVYVAIPVLPGKAIPNRKQFIKLLKRLELGLITVTFLKKSEKVEVIIDPENYKKRVKKKLRESIITEFNNRKSNYNRGGSVGVKLLTAYRESALEIVELLVNHGFLSAKELKLKGSSPKTYNILYKNFYGWFYKSEERGKYGATEKGISALKEFLKNEKLGE